MFRMYSTLTVIFFTLVLGIASVKAIDTNIKVGKYRVGINYSPLIACAVWPNEPSPTGSISYNFRAANSKEYLQLSISVLGFSISDMVKEFEKVPSTRPLTDTEKVFCKEIAQSDLTVLKAVPSKSRDRPTRKLDAITTTKFRVPDTVRCEGDMIKSLYKTRISKNDNWFKVVGLELSTRCGMY